MSISPFDSGNSKPLRSSQVSASKEPMATDSISLSQALIITAGMAGLIGLFSGVIIRFSLANSPNARFLSPLQTFPALSTWTPEPADAVDAEGNISSDGANRDYARDTQADAIRTFESSEPPDYLQEELEEPTDDSLNLTNDIHSVDATTFDTFAARDPIRRRSASDRWEALEAGPKFSQDEDGQLRPYDDYDDSEANSFEGDRSADVNGDLPSEFNDSEDSYFEETYPEEAYPEDRYLDGSTGSGAYSEDDVFYDGYSDEDYSDEDY